MYQNAVALALLRILHRLNWGRLKKSAEEGGEGGGGGSRAKEAAAKSIQCLIGLLSWQLATMWDTVQRVSCSAHVHVHVEHCGFECCLKQLISSLEKGGVVFGYNVALLCLVSLTQFTCVHVPVSILYHSGTTVFRMGICTCICIGYVHVHTLYMYIHVYVHVYIHVNIYIHVHLCVCTGAVGGCMLFSCSHLTSNLRKRIN